MILSSQGVLMKKSLLVKAKAIDGRKDKIVLAGLALVVGLMAAAILSTNVKADEIVSESITPAKPAGTWNPHVQVQDEVKLPFELKTQKFSH